MNMKRIIVALLVLLAVGVNANGQMARESLKSPDGRLEVRFELKDSVPYYSLYRDGKAVVLDSRMGFTLEWRKSDLASGFKIGRVERSSFDEVWQPVWGEEANIRNHYNELAVTLVQDSYLDHEGRRVDKPTVMIVRFRMYNDGLGFRYEFPSDINALTHSNNQTFNSLVTFWLTDELTEFRLLGDPMAWWIPGDYDTQEFNYTQSRLSQVRELHDSPHISGGWPWKSFSDTGLQTALQMKTDDGLYVNIHEAAVLDFPTMNLDLTYNEEVYRLKVHLTPDATGYVGRLTSPCYSPWRTVQVCDKATDVLRSRLILNLNEPCALEDVGWIHPVKYMGVWWEMISDHSTWGYTNDFPSVRLPGDPSLPRRSRGPSPTTPKPNPTAVTAPTTPTCAAISTSPLSTASTPSSSKGGTSAGRTGTARTRTMSSTSSPLTQTSTCRR